MKLDLKGAWLVAKTAAAGFIDDSALSHAAAMAFYAATSLAPILLIVLAIASFVIGHNAAEGHVPRHGVGAPTFGEVRG
jgi:membrane protein